MKAARWLSQAITLVAVGMVTGGCGTSPEADVGSTWMAEHERRGNTTVVRTVSGSVWGDTMHLVPEVAIGVLDGPPEEVLGVVISLDVDTAGQLLVLDAQALEVRIYSENGEHRLSFGRRGGGPGEFQGADQLRATADGRIIVRDQPAQRFSVFSGAGEYLGGWRWPVNYYTNDLFYLDVHGRVVNPSLRDQLVVYDAEGRSTDTIPVPTTGYRAPQLEVAVRGGQATYSIPFVPNEHWAMARNGSLLIGVSDRYAVERRDPDGSVLRIERYVEPAPVTKDEADQAKERITQAILRTSPEWRWQGQGIPSTKPFFRSLQAGTDGTIWVFRDGPTIEEPNPQWDPAQPASGPETRRRTILVADVYDADGRFLGPVTIPESVSWLFPHPVLSQDRVWAATIHEDGHPQVVRFRIQRN